MDTPKLQRLSVFLSYASEDRPAVAAVFSALRNAGFNPWMDRGRLQPGDRWEDEIAEALHAADVLCVFFSPSAMDAVDRYFLRECQLGLEVFSKREPERTIIVPVRLAELELPVQFRLFQWVDLWSRDSIANLENGLRKAAQRLDRLVEPLSVWHFDRARSFLEQQRFGQAITEIDAAIEMDPTSADLRLFRAVCWISQRKFDSALLELDAASDLNPDQYELNILYAQSLRGARRYDDSVHAAGRAVDANPENPSGYFERAQSFELKRYLKRALEDYDKAIELDDQCAAFVAGRARCLSELQEDEEAMAAFGRALSLDPDNAEIYYQRAHAAAQAAAFAGRSSGYQEALTDLQAAIAIDPRSGVYLAERGWVLWSTGDVPAARLAFESAKKLTPTDARVFFTSGLFYQQVQDCKQALEDLDMAVKLDPLDPENFAARGTVRRANNLTREAIRDFTAAISLNPENRNYYKYRGDCYQDIDDMKSAILDIQRYLGGEPGAEW